MLNCLLLLPQRIVAEADLPALNSAVRMGKKGTGGTHGDVSQPSPAADKLLRTFLAGPDKETYGTHSVQWVYCLGIASNLKPIIRIMFECQASAMLLVTAWRAAAAFRALRDAIVYFAVLDIVTPSTEVGDKHTGTVASWADLNAKLAEKNMKLKRE